MSRLRSVVSNRIFLATTAAAIAVLGARLQWGQLQQLLHIGPSVKSHGQSKTFDYVVVGGGTAGLAIATRLAESSAHTVAVIEAGGFYEQDNGNLSTVPRYCSFFAGTDHDNFNPLVDWGFLTKPQKTADERQLHYAQGKTLGGSSARNFMYYHRPTAGSLDKWAEEVGDDGYRFNSLLPFFQKSVQYTPPKLPFSNSTYIQDHEAWSSSGGPLQVSHGNFIDPFGTWIQPAMEALGMKPIRGFQSGQLIGSSYIPYTVDPVKAQRSSSESSFLQSMHNKPSLHVYHNALAERILLDHNQAAYGVVVSSKGSEFTLNAKKEVILSAGAFKSPQLLMLSGIGPRTTLEALSIPVHVELPGVGENLQDHPLFGSQYRVNVPTVSAALNNPSVLAAAQHAYETLAAGPLTIPATGFIGWEKLPEHLRRNLSTSSRKALDSSFPADWPELDILPLNAALGYNGNYQKEDPLDNYNYATIATSLVAPLSRGTVTISSTRASDHPLIDPNFFGHPADAEVAVAAIRRQREIWNAMPSLKIGDEHLPGPNVNSDEEIMKYVKESVGPTWHAASTCKMGRKGDRMAVVDAEAKVFGTKGLRVVDASAFPFLVPGHPQAMIYALAEKIADVILRGGK